MAQTELSSRLKAIQAHLGCTQEDLFKRLRSCAGPGQSFVLSTFSDVMNGKRDRSRKANQIAKTLEVYARENDIDLDRITRDQPSLRLIPRERGNRKVPDECRGAWFLIQYRGKRKARKDVVAMPDYRVAVLVYGADEGVWRKFELIGESTRWEGRVSMNPDDNLLFYSAHEVQRSGIQEWVRLLMHGTFGGSDFADHHGIVLGIGRGNHDAPDFPIYASRALLIRIETEHEKQLTAPLEKSEIAALRKYCGYVSPGSSEEPDTSLSDYDRALITERQKAIRCFEERGGQTAEAQGNFGDRIFVRF
jgi:hypothetical protein